MKTNTLLSFIVKLAEESLLFDVLLDANKLPKCIVKNKLSRLPDESVVESLLRVWVKEKIGSDRDYRGTRRGDFGIEELAVYNF